MNGYNVNNEKRRSIVRNNSLAMRSSTIIARRLSIYLPPSLLPSREPQKLIVDINSHVALFRDMLIHVGQSKDCPELREKIRKLRRTCVEACKHTSQIIMPQVKSALADGVLADNPHLVLLFYLAQLFLRELVKSYRLVQVVPMDMSGYYENRAGPSNLGNVISQILLCKQITPDFNQEELCSITKDSQEIALLLADMQEYMPQHESYFASCCFGYERRGLAIETSSQFDLQKYESALLYVTPELPLKVIATSSTSHNVERETEKKLQPATESTSTLMSIRSLHTVLQAQEKDPGSMKDDVEESQSKKLFGILI